jgi:polyisoprenoid-binding protein YceI
MSTYTLTATQIPAGTWTVDPVHSSATFTVKHMMVGTFRGEFTRIEGSLSDGKLVGRVKIDSIQVKDAGLKEHLLSPEFFDAERYPEIVYESATVDLQDGSLISTGTLTLKGKTTEITAVGTLAGPVVTLGDVETIGINLKATVAREAVGLRWNAPLPEAGVVLGPHVTIAVSLELALADDEG